MPPVTRTSLRGHAKNVLASEATPRAIGGEGLVAALPIRHARFPAGFAWGVGTAAPQIEGAAASDGKGPSIWDVYCRVPGRIANRHTLDVACDHYARYEEDIALMADLGVAHYRFSIAWTRILPAGRGAVNAKGVAFYDRLIDALLARGIAPWVTMFHWDLPQALEAEGGWRVREVVDAFRQYAETIVRAYGDRVKQWITLNEIACFTRMGYGSGDKAPGARESDAIVNQTYHHALLCHGAAVSAVRAHGGAGARVGLTDNAFVPVPVTETPADIDAARRLFVTENLRVLDPVFTGRYAPEYLAAAGAAAPQFREDDFAAIAQPTDFLGLNIYTGAFVRAGGDGRPEILEMPQSFPRADSRWLTLNARALYWGPRLAAEVYGVRDICITENGAGYDDAPPVNGEVLDVHRIAYVRHCLAELKRAIDDGAPVTGYFLWSLMDNFEWQDGYTRRFGIVYVDFKTQRRTPKLSSRWYAHVIAENALV